MPGRVEIDNVQPVVSCGAYPAKAVVGEVVPVSATVWREGHEAVAATLVVRYLGPRYPATETRRIQAVQAPEAPVMASRESTPVDAQKVKPLLIPMTMGQEPYVFHGQFTPDSVGLWSFRVDGWGDPIHTWRHGLMAKLDAGQGEKELSNDLLVGAALFERAATGVPRPLRDRLLSAATALRTPGDPLTRSALALAAQTEELLTAYPLRDIVTRGEQCGIWVDRPAARFSAWYEMFPRSTGGRDADGKPVHGTFATAAAALGRIADMGFDVVYLPPIHPIGKVHRKGRNNSPAAAPGDVGSPWAIGSDEGGHDAVHPSLGTIDDFDDVRRRRARPGSGGRPGSGTAMCAGSSVGARTPQVVHRIARRHHRLRRESAEEVSGHLSVQLRQRSRWHSMTKCCVWSALGVDHGVKVFRVDNPHTKPPNFWAWLMGRSRTRPRRAVPVRGLHPSRATVRAGQLGFTQSYSYFTWRTSQVGTHRIRQRDRWTADYRRPNLFVNTPDILHQVLQHARPGHVRHPRGAGGDDEPAWACTPATNCSSTARSRGSEEYLDSEKYELRPRDFAGAAGRRQDRWSRSLTGSTRLRAHPALQQVRTIDFHQSTTMRCWHTASSTRPPATACWWW